MRSTVNDHVQEDQVRRPCQANDQGRQVQDKEQRAHRRLGQGGGRDERGVGEDARQRSEKRISGDAAQIDLHDVELSSGVSQAGQPYNLRRDQRGGRAGPEAGRDYAQNRQLLQATEKTRSADRHAVAGRG